MHQPAKDKFVTVTPEAFSPKPLSEVRRRLTAILEYWGDHGERHHCGMYGPNGGRCFVTAMSMIEPSISIPEQYAVIDAAKPAAVELGFSDVSKCSDSGFANARKMVLRAIELAA